MPAQLSAITFLAAVLFAFSVMEFTPRDIREMEAEAASLLWCESFGCFAGSHSLRNAVPRVQIRACRTKTTRKMKPLRGSLNLFENGLPGHWALANGAALYREEPIPAANAFGGRRSGFGPCLTAQCRIRVVACAFASQVRRSRT